MEDEGKKIEQNVDSNATGTNGGQTPVSAVPDAEPKKSAALEASEEKPISGGVADDSVPQGIRKHGVGRFRLWLDNTFSSVLLWRSNHVSDMPFVFILTTVAGFFAGLSAFLLKRSVEWMTTLMEQFKQGKPDFFLLMIPIAGIFIAVILCRYVFKVDAAHGVRQLMKGFKKNIYTVNSKIVYSPLIASIITLGFGGSAGSEGPIAFTGAAIGSNLGKTFRLSPDFLRIMVGCGAGAGIAGIFKAPIAGVLFTIEVLRLPLSTVPVIALVASCLTAALTSYVFSGCTIDMTVMQLAPFDPAILPPVLALGVFCGCYSLYYTYAMKKLEGWLGKISNVWLKALVGGALLSVLVFLFPSLYGEGYDTIGQIVNGDAHGLLHGTFFFGLAGNIWALILSALAIVLVKCIATSATNNSGGVAGDFAPTLFAGCVAGAFFVLLADKLFGLHFSMAEFALFGMAGVMAGAIRAPLLAIFLVMEMTASYALILPIVLTSSISFGIVRLFTFDNFYSRYVDRNNGLLSFGSRSNSNAGGPPAKKA